LPEPETAPPAQPGPHLTLRVAAALLDPDGLVTGWNSAACARFALDGAEVIGRPLDELGDLAADPSLLRLPLDGGGALAVWPDPSAATATDVQLAKARALESLAGPIKHELVSPLNAIALFAGIVRLEGEVPDDLVGRIGELADAADRVTRLTSLTLELARERPAAVQAVRPAQVVDEVLDLAAYLLVDAELTVQLDPAPPEVEVDRAGFRLALLLVLLDAIRALGTPRARGRLRIEGRSGDDGRTVEIVVEADAPDRSPASAAAGSAPVDAGHRTRSEADIAAARALLQRDGGDLRRMPEVGGVRRTILAAPRSGAGTGDDAAAQDGPAG
jgi:hypothetical protein